MYMNHLKMVKALVGKNDRCRIQKLVVRQINEESLLYVILLEDEKTAFSNTRRD